VRTICDILSIWKQACRGICSLRSWKILDFSNVICEILCKLLLTFCFSSFFSFTKCFNHRIYFFYVKRVKGVCCLQSGHFFIYLQTWFVHFVAHFSHFYSKCTEGTLSRTLCSITNQRGCVKRMCPLRSWKILVFSKVIHAIWCKPLFLKR